MQTIIIVLDPDKMCNADLDIRYELPMYIEKVSNGKICENSNNLEDVTIGDEDIENTVMEAVESTEIPDNLEEDFNDINDDIDQIYHKKVEAINQRVKSTMYLRVLAPILKKNEEKKREHRDVLIKILPKMLTIQLVFVGVCIFVLVLGAMLNGFVKGKVDFEIKGFFDLFKVYIGAIIAELISILCFMAKSVFSENVVDLIKNFDQIERDDKKK